jgi:Amt family ammonium transporter
MPPLSRRVLFLFSSLLAATLMSSWYGHDAVRAQEAKPAASAAVAAPAPDPTKPAASPDPSGNYTGAGTTGALTLDNGKATLDTLTKDVALLKINGNMIWALIAGFLVMFMQAGFALVETGLTRAKNVAHTMAMNIAIYGIGMLGYYICGFALQMGGVGPLAYFNGPDVLHNMVKFELFGKPFEVLGYTGFFLGGDSNDMSVLTIFLFQMVFMDTAATIPTGALAERWKFSAFVVYGFLLSMLIYPVYACWVWGGGWLADLGVNFGLGNGHMDFAGSSVVHMTGGVTALAGALVLGPRIGKFNKDGSANAIPGHSIPMVVLGTLILAFGWFGFNGGSTLALADGRTASVCVCTMLASAAGMFTSMLYMWFVFGKPDPTMACNGMLAGLVAITAPCAFVSPLGSVIIGGLAGVLVIWSVLFVERALKVDDPVGAISVHGVCGAFGCLCIGLFADGKYGTGWNGVADKTPLGLFYGGGVEQLIAQSIGVAANILWVFPVAGLSFMLIEKTIGNRVSAKDEINGLDIPEMGIFGYISEDPIIVQNAGQDHLSTHGPGVPLKRPVANGMTLVETRVPVERS